MKKVAIVGVEGSGKTVMLAGLGNLYTYPDEEGYFLVPKNFGTAAYVADKIERMRKGEWPVATAGDEMQGLDWTLKCKKPGQKERPNSICEVSFLDFAGEVYRAAYGISGSDAALYQQVEALRRYVRGADNLIVLINLRDVIVGGTSDKRVQEAMWITKAILDDALGESDAGSAPRTAIVLSQADSYADTIKACGGPSGTLARHLPYVYNEYSWLDVFSANGVDKTELDDIGNVIPARDFSTVGLRPIMDWVLERKKDGNIQGGTSASEAEGKTEFAVILSDVGSNKIAVIKEIRSITGLGLKDAKDMVEGAPKTVTRCVSRKGAERIKMQLERAGANVKVKAVATLDTDAFDTTGEAELKDTTGEAELKDTTGEAVNDSRTRRPVNGFLFSLVLLVGGVGAIACLNAGHWGVSIFIAVLLFALVGEREERKLKLTVGPWLLCAALLLAAGVLGVSGHWIWSSVLAFGGVCLVQK